MLPEYLRREAARRLAAPRQGGAAARRELFRARFVEGLGGLPARTPLNARTAGVIDRGDHRIEKVIFESQPGFYVTANLYLPKGGRPPYPGILFPLGHEPGAKANPVWQQLLVTFARRGYVALAWDTLGQGERIQLFDADLRGSKLRQSTTEHTMQGIQCLLAGDSLARYTVWDGIRALDYLVSRPEVDPARIGCTGNSGGGTHTAYLAALDDRIQAAAPSCYLTTWSRLLDTIGPQDAEQCVPGFLAAGLDHSDFAVSFAPKPYLILSAIRDFFSIRGARKTFAAARRAYESEGAGGRIAMTEADDGHGYSKPRRLAAYEWFTRWLKGGGGPAGEEAVTPLREQELWCTPSGQVATSLGGETVFSLNRRRAREYAAARRFDPAAAARLIGWRREDAPPPAQPYGRALREGLIVEKLLYESEPGIRIPAVVVSQPGRTPGPGVVLADGRGKSAAWAEIAALASRGAAVLALDARGTGETRAAAETKGSDWPQWFGDYDSAMTAVLLGRNLAGMRAFDIARGFALLASREGVDPQRIHGAARGAGAAVPMLHAAAAGVPFAGVLLDGMLASYQSAVETPIHRGIFEDVVVGSLRHYDLADLAAALAPRAVRIVDAIDPLGNPLPLSEARREFARATAASVHRRAPDEAPAEVYRRMLD